MNTYNEAEAEIADCSYRFNGFVGEALRGSKVVTDADVDEFTSSALVVLISGGSEGGKEIIGKSVVGLIFFWYEVI